MSNASIADRLDLLQLAFRYGTVVDDRDWPALGQIFTDDVEFDITDFAGTVTKGLDALIALMDSPNARHPVAHLITNVYVESLDGDARHHAEPSPRRADRWLCLCGQLFGRGDKR
ncbi:MAG TPA: nuclear transport factor 2 family protein [Solirubrobacteraceae bacterium]